MKGSTMLKELQNLIKKTYSPYSKFPVSAIVIDKKGNKYYGVNVESAVFPLGICAERNAIFSAITSGIKPKELKEVHIYGGVKNKVFISPCGACRQIIIEFVDQNGIVVMYQKSEKEITKIVKVNEIIPFAFSAGDLK